MDMNIIVGRRVMNQVLEGTSKWDCVDWWQSFCFDTDTSVDIDKVLFEWGGRYRESYDACWIEFEDERMASLFLLRWS